MSIDAQLRAASVLMLCTPPRRSAVAVRSLARLRGGASEHEPAFIEHLLGTANQVLKPIQCANERCEQRFLPSEFNRDGDAYRCPWCNKYTANGRSFPRRMLGDAKSLRALEKQFIEQFQEYGKLYYGESCVTNCFVWSNDGTVDDIGVAVLIAHDQVHCEDSRGMNVWNSSHVFTVRLDPRERRTAYRGYTTVYVDVGAGPCRFSGFVDRKPPTFYGPVVVNLDEHIVRIGDHVQRVENALRDDIALVHFAKAAQVTSALRSYSLTRKAAVDDPLSDTTIASRQPPPPMPMPIRAASTAPQVSVPPPPPRRDPEPVSPPDAFQEEEEAAQPETEDAPDDQDVAEDGGVVEVDEAEITIAQVLESLELDGVEDIVAALEAAGITTPSELLECTDEFLKADVGLPKSVRKAVAEWVSWQFDEDAQ